MTDALPEFDCTGLMAAGSWGAGCRCMGCQANRAIAAAVAAERERCLKLCAAFALAPGADTLRRGMALAAKKIATHIREGTP